MFSKLIILYRKSAFINKLHGICEGKHKRIWIGGILNHLRYRVQWDEFLSGIRICCMYTAFVAGQSFEIQMRERLLVDLPPAGGVTLSSACQRRDWKFNFESHYFYQLQDNKSILVCLHILRTVGDDGYCCLRWFHCCRFTVSSASLNCI